MYTVRMVEDTDSFLGADCIAVAASLQDLHPPHPHPAGGGRGAGVGEGGVELLLYPAQLSKHQTPANTSSVI